MTTSGRKSPTWCLLVAQGARGIHHTAVKRVRCDVLLQIKLFSRSLRMYPSDRAGGLQPAPVLTATVVPRLRVCTYLRGELPWLVALRAEDDVVVGVGFGDSRHQSDWSIGWSIQPAIRSCSRRQERNEPPDDKWNGGDGGQGVRERKGAPESVLSSAFRQDTTSKDGFTITTHRSAVAVKVRQ